MSKIEKLLEFERKYSKLYEVLANGVPVYASMRDGVNFVLNNDNDSIVTHYAKKQGGVSFRRIADSFIKLKRFSNAKSAVFTSSVYRRDKGRNLAAEFLMEKYPDAVVFEWPSRNKSFDLAYYKDELKARYCPLEYYLICNKIYIKLHKKEYARLCEECREKLEIVFGNIDGDLSGNYLNAIEYLRTVMPDSYATNIMNQRVFKKLFRKYKNLEYAIDFWGAARENIIPVLPSKPKSIELQHGLISSEHPGYIYPEFVTDLDYDFFKRKILVYGEKIKELLCDLSVFTRERIEVVGNPRIIEYKKKYSLSEEDRRLILFTSQPYEQDGIGVNYYDTVIPYLQRVQEFILSNDELKVFRLAIKLHPREDNSVADLYQQSLPASIVYENSGELYELLNRSYIHITVNSTVLFEAAVFGVPTTVIQYDYCTLEKTYSGANVISDKPNSIESIANILLDRNWYNKYLQSLTKSISAYMF